MTEEPGAAISAAPTRTDDTPRDPLGALPYTDENLAYWRKRVMIEDAMWPDVDVLFIVRRFLATLDATRPSGDEVLRADIAALERRNEALTNELIVATRPSGDEALRAALHDGIAALYGECRHDPTLGTASDCDVLVAAATLATPSSAPDVERLVHKAAEIGFTYGALGRDYEYVYKNVNDMLRDAAARPDPTFPDAELVDKIDAEFH